MTFDMTIQLGHLIVAGTIITAWAGAHYTLVTKMDQLERTLKAFGERMDRHEVEFQRLVSQVQRIIGRMEEQDRRHGHADRRIFNE